MAVTLEGTFRRWLGLSTDAKPSLGIQADRSVVTATDLQAGSSFYETDTGRTFRWDGAAWTAPPIDRAVSSASASLESQIVPLLKQILFCVAAPIGLDPSSVPVID